MLFGDEEVQNIILNKVKQFESDQNCKVIFGAMVGSISKGMTRVDSDYDTRFLYLDNNNLQLSKPLLEPILEKDIHKVFVPEEKDLFYDKIAFWELTSFLDFLRNPMLDNKKSIGLYHIVNWTFRSPFVWDPYGLVGKLSPIIDEMFQMEYELQYYSELIRHCLQKEHLLLREYLYACFYGLSIDWCINKRQFAPVYFPTLLAFLEDENLSSSIKELIREYHSSAEDIVNIEQFQRKMANKIVTKPREDINYFLYQKLETVETYFEGITNHKCTQAQFHNNEKEKRLLEQANYIIQESLNAKNFFSLNDRFMK